MRFFIYLILFQNTLLQAQNFSVKETLDSLCHLKMAGRGYVDDGHKKASQYIAKQFELIGLEKVENSYFQDFAIDVNLFPGKLELQMGRNKLREGYDFIPKSFSGPAKGRKRAIRLDSLIFTDSIRADKFLKSKLKNRVLIYSNSEYEKLSAMPYDFVEKAFSAALTIELKEKLTASYSSRQYKSAGIELLDSFYSPLIKRVKFKIEPEFKENLKTRNVLGVLKSKNEQAPYILITAHYDHIGKMGNAIFPGANDNASGVAMLLDLAKRFKNEDNLPFNLLFIAFGAEEVGLVGSEFYVKQPLIPLSKTRFVLNLDLMGNGEKGITVVNGKVFEYEMQILDSLNTAGNYLPLIKKRDKAANSDHYHFSERGIPAFFIFTMGGEPWYHDVYDTPEKLTLAKYEEIILLLEAFVSNLKTRPD